MTLTLWPRPASARHAFSPSQVSGTLITTLPAMLGKLRAPAPPSVKVSGGHLGGDRAGDRRANLGDDLADRPAGLGDKRRVGGDAVDDAHGGEIADFVDVGGVGEELHLVASTLPPRSDAAGFPLVQSAAIVSRSGRRHGESPRHCPTTRSFRCWCRSRWPRPIPTARRRCRRRATIVDVPLGTRDVVGVVWDDPPDREIGHNRPQVDQRRVRRAAASPGDPTVRRLGRGLHADQPRHGAAHGAALVARAGARGAGAGRRAWPGRSRSA